MATVLITGAGRGLGLELARQHLADAGTTVLATCRASGGAEGLKRLAETSGGRLEILPLEVTDPDSLAALARLLEGRPVDRLINNAGIYSPEGERLGAIDPNAFLQVLRVNTLAPLKVTEALLPCLLAGRGKLVAMIGSRMGSIDDNSSGGYYAYRASKAALNMVARSLAIDLKPRGLTVVAHSPGWVRTDMGGRNAPLSPEESVTRMRSVLGAVRPEQSGLFLDLDGSVIPW